MAKDGDFAHLTKNKTSNDCWKCFKLFKDGELKIHCGDGKSMDCHYFCDHCAKRFCNQVEEKELTQSGMKCFKKGCKESMHLDVITPSLNKDTLGKIRSHCQTNSIMELIADGLQPIKCKKCTFFIVPEPGAEDDRPRFECTQCGDSHCKVCDGEWDEAHACSPKTCAVEEEKLREHHEAEETARRLEEEMEMEKSIKASEEEEANRVQEEKLLRTVQKRSKLEAESKAKRAIVYHSDAEQEDDIPPSRPATAKKPNSHKTAAPSSTRSDDPLDNDPVISRVPVDETRQGTDDFIEENASSGQIVRENKELLKELNDLRRVTIRDQAALLERDEKRAEELRQVSLLYEKTQAELAGKDSMRREEIGRLQKEVANCTAVIESYRAQIVNYEAQIARFQEEQRHSASRMEEWRTNIETVKDLVLKTMSDQRKMEDSVSSLRTTVATRLHQTAASTRAVPEDLPAPPASACPAYPAPPTPLSTPTELYPGAGQSNDANSDSRY